MKAFWKLSLAVLKMYLRDPLTVALSLFLIVFMMVLFGLVMGEEQFKVELPVAVWDRAQTPDSAALLARLDGDEFLVVESVGSEEEILTRIREAKVIGGLVLAPGWTPAATPDQLRLVRDDDANKWLDLGFERLSALVVATGGARTPPWTESVAQLSVVKNRYIDFIFPGILAMAIMQVCLASGVVLLEAREIGVLRRLRLTPVSGLTIFSSVLTGRFLIVVLHLLVLVAVAVFGFGAQILGSWLDLTLLVLLGTLAFMALGIAVAMVAPTLESASLFLQMFSLPMSFLCGVFFKVDSMPAPLEWLSRALPLTYLVDAFRGTVRYGAPLTDHGTEILALLAWFVACLALGARSFRLWSRDSA
ncbi:MAG: ABC transporter permease [Thermoanaerobaculia bacterium]|nr:ABC transporter permease [Thermoanaerobaculia bacterium]